MDQSYITAVTSQNDQAPPMLLPIHKNMLPSLDRDGVRYQVTTIALPCTDMVLIALVPESLNILNLFHAGIHLGAGRRVAA